MTPKAPKALKEYLDSSKLNKLEFMRIPKWYVNNTLLTE
jgi:hypothetical protein